MGKKKVLVVCGTGVATSTVVALAIKKEMTARGIDVETSQCKVSEVEAHCADADLIVSTTQVSANLDKPVIVTLAFLTGVGKAGMLTKIEELLRKA
jgi:PTS system galactitol-specific IIB component